MKLLLLLLFPVMVLAHPFKYLPPLGFGVWCEYHWIPPTERENNTILLSSEIAGYKVETLDSGIWNTDIKPRIVTKEHINIWAIDEVSCYGCQNIRFSTIDTDGRESLPAYPVCPPAQPMACQ